MLKKKNSALILIFIIALALRLVGITYSFPFVFHPDEPTVVRSALEVRFRPNPGHFDWPHLYIYLNYFLYMFFARFRNFLEAVGLTSAVPKIIWNDSLVFYLLTRAFTAVLGALTVIPVYKSGKILFNKKVGLLSALAMALIPFHVWHSHYSLTDVPMVFLMSWAVYFCIKIYKNGNIKDYVLAGAFVGLSASTKYNGGLSAVMVPLAFLLRKVKNKQKLLDLKELRLIFLSGFVAIVSFIIGTPYSVLDFKTFSRTDGPKGAFWQFKNVGSVDFKGHIGKFFSDLFIKLPDDLGYVILLGFVITVLLLIYKLVKKRFNETDFSLALILLPILIYVWYISGFAKSRSHYYMIIYPLICINFGYLSFLISERFKNKNVVLFILFVIPFTLSVKKSYAFKSGDTRNDLYEWLCTNIGSEDVVIYNDRQVADILEDVGVTGYKGFNYIKEIDSALVVVLDAPDLDIPYNLNLIHTIYRNGKVGPVIRIYTY